MMFMLNLNYLGTGEKMRRILNLFILSAFLMLLIEIAEKV